MVDLAEPEILSIGSKKFYPHTIASGNLAFNINLFLDITLIRLHSVVLVYNNTIISLKLVICYLISTSNYIVWRAIMD